MKESQIKWSENKWPLIEMRKTRGDCIEYLKNHNLPVPPKSACIGCPFHSNGFWLDLKVNSPDEWEDACDFDDKIRDAIKHKLMHKVYLHRNLVPLREVNLGEDQHDLFGNECEGHCGL